MAWSNSVIFQQAMLNPMTGEWPPTIFCKTAYAGLVADALVKAALFNNPEPPL